MLVNVSKRTHDMVDVSLFSAIVVILAFTPFIGYIPLGVTKATTVHIPVILASILLGPKKGAAVGFVFGLTSLLNNTFIAPTLTSFVFSPFYSLGYTQGNLFSLIICFVPRILTGVVPYFFYNILKKIFFKSSDIIPLGVAGVFGSLTNTLLVMSFIYIFFGNAYAGANNITEEALIAFIGGIIGINGIPEAIVASIITIGIGKVLIRYRKMQN